MKIAVIGAGYVGLVTGACLAQAGEDVTLVDLNRERVDRINQGEIDIHERELPMIVRRNVQKLRLRATTQGMKPYLEADVIFICVGTPMSESGEADISAVMAVAEELKHAVRSRGLEDRSVPLVIVKSTVPVGTTDKVRQKLSEAGYRFLIANNPEFLREGSAVSDFCLPDRVIIGVEDPTADALLRKLYHPFTQHRGQGVIAMDIRSSEMTKYASNAMLATKISLVNEIANLCEAYGADIEQVRVGMAADHRIGPHFTRPGIGYGGSCFPKDVQALRAMGRAAEVDTLVLEAVHECNEHQKTRMINQVIRIFEGVVDKKRIAVWGTAFKPGTDDVRESPALGVMISLANMGAQVFYYDPEATENTRALLPDSPSISATDSPLDAARDADILLICTDWDQFAAVDLSQLKLVMRRSIILDGRNLIDAVVAQHLGFDLRQVGRPAWGTLEESKT